MTTNETPFECPVCYKLTDYLERYYDRYEIYSGCACSDKCAETLPGQGRMRNYDAEEPIEPEEPVGPREGEYHDWMPGDDAPTSWDAAGGL